MKVLHVYKTYYPDSYGGVQTAIHQLAIETKLLGVESHVFTVSPNPSIPIPELEGQYIHQVKRTFQLASTDFSINAFTCFSKLIKKVDLVHYHYPWPFMDLMHFRSNMQKPTVLTYHADIVKQKILRQFYRPLQRKFLKSVDKIVVTSPNYMKTSPILPFYVNKVEIIPLGLSKQTYTIADHELFHQWQQKLPPRFFLFVGVLRYYKGLSLLIEAANLHQYPVVILGSGPLESKLKKKAKQLKCHSIFFLGELPHEDKIAIISLSFCIVLPSVFRSEAFGIALLEGAMYGKPLISSEIGTGTSYINVHNDTGLIFKNSCIFSLAQAMQYFWDNPVQCRQMGMQAQQRFQKLFTAEEMAQSYYDLYLRCLAKRS